MKTLKNVKDLTGERFGRLTVIGLHPTETRKTYWECQCDCGNTGVVLGNALSCGKSKSCGCLRREKSAQHLYDISKNNYIDEIGNKYGKLTVISKTINDLGQLRWKCKCDCGNITIVSSNSLRSGNTQSCGCIGKSKGEWKIEELLTKNNIIFTKEFPVITKNRRFRFDFAIFKDNQLLYFIEYNGEQHYYPIDFFGGEEYFKYIQENDLIKEQYCIENNIPLIKIKYTQYKNLKIEDLII